MALTAELTDLLGTTAEKSALPQLAEWFPQNEPTHINPGRKETIIRTIVPGEITLAFAGDASLDELRLALANKNIFINPVEIAGNSIDDDGNSFIDEVKGWDFVASDNNPSRPELTRWPVAFLCRSPEPCRWKASSRGIWCN